MGELTKVLASLTMPLRLPQLLYLKDIQSGNQLSEPFQLREYNDLQLDLESAAIADQPENKLRSFLPNLEWRLPR